MTIYIEDNNQQELEMVTRKGKVHTKISAKLTKLNLAKQVQGCSTGIYVLLFIIVIFIEL